MASEFKTLTLRKFSSMRTRFKAQYKDDGQTLKRAGREIPFALDEFREWVVGQVKQGVYVCSYCEKRLLLADVEIDHVVPVKRGGELGLHNLAVSCKRCNQTKGELTAEEYRAFISGLQTFPEAARNDILKRLRTAAMGARMRFHPREGKSSVAANPASRRAAVASPDLFTEPF